MKNMDSAKDIVYLINNLEEPILTEPEDHEDDATKAEIYKWQQKLDKHLRRENLLEENKGNVYAVIYGKCSEMMKSELKATK